ncbi:DeoR/GlpR family DNA-binding transcription regulator [Pseudalkalibacillus decolorationis]|uniref:DeoR/GlpR family DNA-binding transcription regulator n=1 Tax=Pseudalkalibacillus decolorationis TaxID=163879 RepID=UPI002147CFA2|nr:DeoR/GlpR family DNA-binding transcription regulator [Pseudalkalibacillus decolorationis]
MLTTKRQQIILSILKKQLNATIHELSEATNASISTIRRDLEQLEKEEKLKRVHGGASYIQTKLYEPKLEDKQGLNEVAKEQIAIEAGSLVEEGDCLFIDAGTTTRHILPHLVGKNNVVVTNAYHFVDFLLRQGIETYITGGRAKSKTGALIGVQAEDSLMSFRFDKCFVGINGIHPVHGFTTPDPEEARIKRMAIELSREAYVVADETKFQEVSFSKVADLKKASIITDLNETTLISALAKLTEVRVVNK